MKHYVVIWVECETERDAERVEAAAVPAVERIAGLRLVQNTIQHEEPS
jgi:hypothetical protein